MTSSDTTPTASRNSAAGHRRGFGAWVRTAAASAAALAAVAAGTPGEVSAVASEGTGARLSYTKPFHVASFNVLGASHTRNGGKGMQSYTKRLPRALSLIDELGLSVIGFQELEEVQWRLYKKLTGKKWGFWPGNRLGSNFTRNSVGWRRNVWEQVERHTYQVPYFHGNLRKNPYVKLRNRETGQEVWFMNTHNPADARGPAAKWRRQSVRIQAKLANDLEATGYPVVFTGDFNDREKAFCPLTRLSALKSASGGGWEGGTCEVPRYSRIDWIFTSQWLQASDYKLREGDVIDRITDHPVITARVAVPKP